MLLLDVWIQLERRGTISWATRPFVAIAIVNLLLWIDFNITIFRRKNQNRPQTGRLRLYPS